MNKPRMICNLKELSGAEGIESMVVYQNELYLSLFGGSGNEDVWKYNFKDSPKAVVAFNNLQAARFFVFRDKLIFSGKTKQLGRELWQYDGRTCKLVAEIGEGANRNGIPGDFMEFKGKLYFSAANVAAGIEIWEYDGNNPPRLVKDINPGENGSYPVPRIVYQGKLFFTAKSANDKVQLWAYDGLNSLSLVGDLYSNYEKDTDLESFVIHDDKLYFANYESGHSSDLKVLWCYNGKKAPQPVLTNLKDRKIGFYRVNNLFVSNNRLFFSGTNGHFGNELYEYKSHQ
jgi:ELWxxDGT repeat protein